MRDQEAMRKMQDEQINRYQALHKLASDVVEVFDGEVDDTGTLGSWADQLTTAMGALRKVVGTPNELTWACKHCGRDCKGPHAFGVHIARPGQRGLQSCDERDTGQPYGLRAHAEGTVAAHCNCSGDHS